MRTAVIVTLAMVSVVSNAHASVSNFQYLEAARCRGLAASENLGKLDTTAIDAFLRTEGGAREPLVRTSAKSKIEAALKQADAADGEKKAKLLAERGGSCAAYIAGGK